MLTGNCKHCKNTLDLKTQYKIATCFCFCTFEILWTPWIPTRIRTNFVRWLRSLHCSVLIKHPTSLKTSASYATAGKLLTNKLGLLMSPVRRNTGRTHGQINLSGVNAQARAGTLDRTVFFWQKQNLLLNIHPFSEMMCRNDWNASSVSSQGEQDRYNIYIHDTLKICVIYFKK